MGLCMPAKKPENKPCNPTVCILEVCVEKHAATSYSFITCHLRAEGRPNISFTFNAYFLLYYIYPTDGGEERKTYRQTEEKRKDRRKLYHQK